MFLVLLCFLFLETCNPWFRHNHKDTDPQQNLADCLENKIRSVAGERSAESDEAPHDYVKKQPSVELMSVTQPDTAGTPDIRVYITGPALNISEMTIRTIDPPSCEEDLSWIEQVENDVRLLPEIGILRAKISIGTHNGF